jgi:hypothetical protein
MLGVVKSMGAMAISHCHKSLNEGDILIFVNDSHNVVVTLTFLVLFWFCWHETTITFKVFTNCGIF